MTEIRKSTAGGGLGVFATQAYKMGDSIVPPMLPLIRLSPTSLQQEQEIIQEYFSHLVVATAKTNDDNDDDDGHKPRMTLLDCIDTIVDISDGTEDNVNNNSNDDSTKDDDDSLNEQQQRRRTIKHMILVVLCYVHNNWTDDAAATSTREKLLQLYHPAIQQQQPAITDDKTPDNGNKKDKVESTTTNNNNNIYEEKLVQLSQRAIELIQTKLLMIKASNSSGTTTTPSKLQQFIQQNRTTSSSLTASVLEELQKVMLIWACNAFEGGRIYEECISRINHSCNPNCIVHVTDDNATTAAMHKQDDQQQQQNDDANDEDLQSIRAVAPIAMGDEITISYLGIWLYADQTTRQTQLQRDKYFTCSCPRCGGSGGGTSSSLSTVSLLSSTPTTSIPDMAQAIPCPVCHARIRNQLLCEDDQYDDELQVHYVCPRQPCTNCGVDIYNNIDDTPGTTSHHNTTCAPSYEGLLQTNQKVVDKVGAFLRNEFYETVSVGTNRKNTTHRPSTKTSNNDAEEEEDDRLDDELTKYMTMASTVLGARHWTTNHIQLLLLDQLLTSYHSQLLATNGVVEEEDSALETIAEAIDMLQRMERYVTSLQLQLHIGHLLSSVIIGTARALVSLGDTKSQKYAADWLNKLTGTAGEDNTGTNNNDDNYLYHFESEGVQKVVETLQVAWKRSKQQQQQEEPTSNKRSKR